MKKKMIEIMMNDCLFQSGIRIRTREHCYNRKYFKSVFFSMPNANNSDMRN